MRDTIYHNTTTHLSFWNRVKVLLGKPVIVESEIIVETPCENGFLRIVGKGVSRPIIPSLFPKKQKGGLQEVSE